MAVCFEHRFTVALHDTDAAGVMFFAHLLRHAHDAYEAFMVQLGLPLAQVLAAGEYQLPIVHCECEFQGPLRLGQAIRVELSLARLGEHSFTCAYRFLDAEHPLASASTVHVMVAAAGGKALALPAALVEAMAPFVQ